MIVLKSPSEVDQMRENGQIVVKAIKEMAAHIRPGISTSELDAIGEAVLEKHGAKPSFKGYKGFTGTACISVNDEVVHGVPGKRIIIEGDIVTLDIGAFKGGVHGDAAWTYPCGEITAETQRLLNVTKESLMQGVAQAREGKRIGDIGAAVQGYVEKNGYSVVRDLVGHGIGHNLHEDPSVPNFGRAGTGAKLRAGMTICIEPMINQGKHKVHTLKDHWTVVTDDGKLSAHFEHMVLVTAGAAEILTLHED